MYFIWSISLQILTFLTFIINCHGQIGGMIAMPALSEFIKNVDEDSEVLSRKQLKSIFGVAKNISHSKGPIIKSKEGDFHYRRSFTSKVETEVNTLHLKNTISAIKLHISNNELDKSLLLEKLDFLESLVHQYDVGKKFIDVDGFNVVLSLTKSKDYEISNVAFIVLAAALQGNVDVQEYALKTELMKFIFQTLQQPVKNRLNSALLCLSAFIRNYPKSLEAFLLNKGLYILSLLFNDDSNKVTKTHLRIINILNDISMEMQDEYQSPKLMYLKRTYLESVESFSLCDKMVDIFSVSDDYIAQEKILSALTSMYDICEDTYRRKYLIENLKIQMQKYDPSKSLTMWYPIRIDLELQHHMFDHLKILLKKLTGKKYRHLKKIKNEL